MSAVVSAIVLILSLSVCANAQTRRLAVYTTRAAGLDTVSTDALQKELRRLLTPTGLLVSWQMAGQPHDSDRFEQIVVGSFDGTCSVDELSALPRKIAESPTLAETSVAHGGRVLPFFRVDCARTLQTIRPSLEPLSLPLRRVLFGRALARVVAHEIYHIVSQARDHDEFGLAKPNLSLDDLTAQRFDFSRATLARMMSGYGTN